MVPRARDAQIIAASIKKSLLWRFVQSRKLTVNMRLLGSGGESHGDREFPEFLLRFGEGRHETNDQLGSDYARIPDDLLLPAVDESMCELIETFRLNVRRLADHLYEDVANTGPAAFDYLSERAILTPLNTDMQEINDEVLRRLPSDMREYLSLDSVECDDVVQRDLYPVEFLNTISVSGLPTHRLRLKEGASILLMRNLDPQKGLCNGTRLLIRHPTVLAQSS